MSYNIVITKLIQVVYNHLITNHPLSSLTTGPMCACNTIHCNPTRRSSCLPPSSASRKVKCNSQHEALKGIPHTTSALRGEGYPQTKIKDAWILNPLLCISFKCWEGGQIMQKLCQCHIWIVPTKRQFPLSFTCRSRLKEGISATTDRPSRRVTRMT